MTKAVLTNEDQLVIDGIEISNVVFAKGGIASGYTLDNIDEVLDYLISTRDSANAEWFDKQINFLEDLTQLSYEFVFTNSDYTSLVVPSSNKELYDSICNEYLAEHNIVINSIYSVLVTDVEWDIDEEDADAMLPDTLPKTLIVNLPYSEYDQLKSEDEISEYISDKITDLVGFCHNGFAIDMDIPQA